MKILHKTFAAIYISKFSNFALNISNTIYL